MTSSIWRLFIATTAIVSALLISGCDNKDDKKPANLSGAQWLYACSPFESFDGERMLIFRIPNHTVQLTEAVGDDRKLGALEAKNPVKTNGAWTLDETARTLDIEVGTTTAKYTLVIPASEAFCILSAGAINSVDLNQSWFGEPDFSDDSE